MTDTTNLADLPQITSEQAAGAEVETETPEAADDATETETVEDIEELEVGEHKLKVSKAVAAELRKERMLHADYTKKTQRLAEDARQIDARKAEIDARADAARQHIEDVAELHVMDKQLSAYQRVDWNRLYEENQQAYDSHWRQYTLLKDQRGEVVQKIRQKDEERAVETQRATAKRYDEARAVLSREVSDWGPELVGKIEQYGITQGYTPKDLIERAADPRDVIALNKARLYDELIAKQKREAKKLPQRQDAPVTQVTTGRAQGRVDPDKLSMDEWLKWDAKQDKLKKAAAR